MYLCLFGCGPRGLLPRFSSICCCCCYWLRQFPPPQLFFFPCSLATNRHHSCRPKADLRQQNDVLCPFSYPAGLGQKLSTAASATRRQPWLSADPSPSFTPISLTALPLLNRRLPRHRLLIFPPTESNQPAAAVARQKPSSPFFSFPKTISPHTSGTQPPTYKEWAREFARPC